MLAYFHCFSVFVWTGEKDANTLRCGLYFLFYFILFDFCFENGEKKLSFQKYPDTVEGARNRTPTAQLLKKSTRRCRPWWWSNHGRGAGGGGGGDYGANVNRNTPSFIILDYPRAKKKSSCYSHTGLQ